MTVDTKYICVGNSKTGTTSLLKAFQILKFRCVSYDLEAISLHIQDRNENLLNKAANVCFLKDWPWRYLYKEMDGRYRCKFIMTVRNEDEWFDSYVNHITNEPYHPINKSYRMKIHGFDPKEHLTDKNFLIDNIYRRNNNDVMNYFKDRDKDLLVMNIFTENPWERLCSFVDVEIPQENFPHENKKITQDKIHSQFATN